MRVPMKCARVCQLTQILVVVIAGCSASFRATEKNDLHLSNGAPHAICFSLTASIDVGKNGVPQDGRTYEETSRPEFCSAIAGGSVLDGRPVQCTESEWP